MVHQKYHGSQQELKILISLEKEFSEKVMESKKPTTQVLEIQFIEKEEIGLQVSHLTTELVKVSFQTSIITKTKSPPGTIVIQS